MVTRPQESIMVTRPAVLCIKHMINAIVDSHKKMFYRTAGLKISAHLTVKRAQKNWLTYIRWSLFKLKIILNFLTHQSTT